MRNKLQAAALLLAAMLPLSILQAQEQGPDAKLTKEQVIQYAHFTEQNPLDHGTPHQRTLALRFVNQDHDTHVLVCVSLFNSLNANHSPHAADIRSQMLLSASAFLYENPDAAQDSVRQSLAGMTAALHVYQAWLAADPKTRSPWLDDMYQQSSAGTLKQYVEKACE